MLTVGELGRRRRSLCTNAFFSRPVGVMTQHTHHQSSHCLPTKDRICKLPVSRSELSAYRLADGGPSGGDFSPSHVIGWETVCRHADEVVSGVWRVSEGRVASGFMSYDVFDSCYSMCAHAVVDTGSGSDRLQNFGTPTSGRLWLANGDDRCRYTNLADIWHTIIVSMTFGTPASLIFGTPASLTFGTQSQFR